MNKEIKMHHIYLYEGSGTAYTDHSPTLDVDADPIGAAIGQQNQSIPLTLPGETPLWIGLACVILVMVVVKRLSIRVHPRALAASLLLCGLGVLAVQLSAAYLPPAGPRLARSLSDAQVARAVTNAPAGARVSVPMHRARPWTAGGWQAGQVCTHSNAVYVCVQTHVAQAAWRPPIVPALWRLVRAATDTPGQPPAWRQPLGAHDAYALGARVTHAGAIWISTIAANVWEPGVHGWRQED